MANDLKSPRKTANPTTPAEDAIEQMFGYYSRDTRSAVRAANDSGARVISELDAAGAILAAKRVA
ncbi:hypothetical protein FNJ84_05390 [Paracoccus sp. M683]|uniref:hypothetical protein n=1 Tax=Paracoccus sp. M683 TaxID=2594268 RepID=UPI00117E12E3|nr:hypothetical protein [Paracoccus sp. M683]TRW98219.1 hypothetical protein FNJ84_05390 [Paracoccus sp. M683]